MVVPTQGEIKKREEKLKAFLKKLDRDGKPRQQAVLNIVRSAIRQAWMKSDTKLAYLYMNTIPDMDETTRSKWLFKCEICGGVFKLAEIECDHKVGHNAFTNLDEFQSYFENILMVGFDGLQILCKNDHAIKSLMEAQGLSWDQAVLEKQVIEIMKSKKDKEWLKEHGVTPASNHGLRREQVRGILKGNEKEG